MFRRRRHEPYGEYWRHCYECHGESPIPLPFEILEAAHKGNVPMIKEYIAKDYDINASYEGDSLLSRACAEGYADIVSLLIQCPEIHLNRQNQGRTPLVLASQNGHTDCMMLLINSTCECELTIDDCWRDLANVLPTQPELKLQSALRILHGAGSKGQWDIVRLILQMNHHFTMEDYLHFLTKAADQDRWDIIREVFKREFLGKNELPNGLLPIVVRMRCWDRVKEVLSMKSAELKLDIPVVEAALDGREEDLQRLSVKGHLDPLTLNGSLLVVAAGGTTATVAKFLLSFKNTYTKKTFSDALFMAASGNSIAIFPLLLSSKEAEYSFDELSKIDNELKFVNGSKFLLQYFNKFIDKHQDMTTGGLVL